MGIAGIVVDPDRYIRVSQVGQQREVHGPVLGIGAGVNARDDIGPGDDLAAALVAVGPGGVLSVREQRAAGIREVHVHR